MNKKVQLGMLGEALVANHFGVKLNENFFDTQKDLVINGETVEVKTQNRHPSKDLLTISAPNGNIGLNNFAKCFHVDRLIFVEYDSSDTIKIWECNDRMNFETYVTKQGKAMVGFPIGKMKLLKAHLDPQLARQMRSLSSSSVFN